jgi:phage shock protein C
MTAEVETEPRRLYRSRRDRKVAGVLGGIAEHYNVDPSLVRILYIVAAFFTAVVPLSFMYFLMWLIIPLEPRRPAK